MASHAPQSQADGTFDLQESIAFDNHQMIERGNPRTAFVSTTCTRVYSMLQWVSRQKHKISEVCFGIDTFTVTIDMRKQANSCFLRYDESTEAWTPVQNPPQCIGMRSIRRRELAGGCRELVDAGCFFYTFEDTPVQEVRPIVVSSALLNDMFSALGFDRTIDVIAKVGKHSYKLFKSRRGREEPVVVSVEPHVNGLGRGTGNRDVAFLRPAMAVRVRVYRQEKLYQVQRRFRQGLKNLAISVNEMRRIQNTFGRKALNLYMS